jgi:hypothetical protein
MYCHKPYRSTTVSSNNTPPPSRYPARPRSLPRAFVDSFHGTLSDPFQLEWRAAVSVGATSESRDTRQAVNRARSVMAALGVQRKFRDRGTPARWKTRAGDPASAGRRRRCGGRGFPRNPTPPRWETRGRGPGLSRERRAKWPHATVSDRDLTSRTKRPPLTGHGRSARIDVSLPIGQQFSELRKRLRAGDRELVFLGRIFLQIEQELVDAVHHT